MANHLAPGLDGGGTTRLFAIVLAAVLAVVVCHRHHALSTVLALVAVGFFLRIALETEMNWYYLWPVPALCLLLALRRRGAVRFVVLRSRWSCPWSWATAGCTTSSCGGPR